MALPPVAWLGSLVTTQQCRDLYGDCSEAAPLELYTVRQADGASHTFPYQRWCPCFDKSGAPSGASHGP